MEAAVVTSGMAGIEEAGRGGEAGKRWQWFVECDGGERRREVKG